MDGEMGFLGAKATRTLRAFPPRCPPAAALLWRLALILAIAGGPLMSSSRVVAAQERSVTKASTPHAHRFFDTTNIVLTGIESGALVADGIYTQRGLTKYPDVLHEGDPIARPFVSRGWPGQIAGGTIFVTADVGLRYLCHRTEHHRLERWIPMILTVYGTVGAVQGAREIHRVERVRSGR
jgi:hypothetical protein